MSSDNDLDIATLIFGPGDSPWLDAARAIQAGHDIAPDVIAQIQPDIDRRFQTGRFRLIDFAWRMKNLRALAHLLAAGADPKAPGPAGQEGEDLVFRILTSQQEPLAMEAVKILLANGLDPNWRRTSDEVPILQYPVFARDLDVAKPLLAAGADPWLVSGDPAAPYNTSRIAADNQNLEFLDYIADHGAFDGRPHAEVESILKSLARIRQNGDAISLAIQQTTRLIMTHADYPPDASTNFILGKQ